MALIKNASGAINKFPTQRSRPGARSSMTTMPAMPSIDGSNGPPPYSYGSPQQHHQSYPRGYGPPSQLTERTPMLRREFDAEIESGLPTVPKSVDVSESKNLPLWAVFAILSFCLYVGYTLNPMLNAAYHEALKRGWDIEERYHQNLREAWTTEKRHHDVLQTQMHQERKVMEEERKSWAREREERERRQKEQERRMHDEEVKKRAGISWEGLEAAEHCLRYGTREHTAILTHVPAGFDALEECRNKPIEVHGRFMVPSRCEDQGLCGRVTGFWNVNFSEPACGTWWRSFEDKGCYESGVRLYHSELENLQGGEDWRVMCSTTPGNIQGVHYDGPTSCVDWGSIFGVRPWGIWHVNDKGCL
ncbi:hypothetical protein M413DRAFT_23494 [Hebeloma cylindrosporum]|uniref:Uncharacterized protein n=1 Tax=Hebeloma cylindrosporum TaxID=76867 RepID=A0A0C3CTS0_HEBCY|nr:hypothetical protein M413DRAFT_23494 [Hebeloma cylindrosporum h7]